MTVMQRSVITLAVALVAAVVVALSLAWFMYFLTHSSELRLSATDRVQMLDFVRLKREELTERKERKPQRPEVQDVPDAPPNADNARSDGATLAVSAPTVVSADLDLGGGLGLGTGDGEYLPIVKVAPIYPRRAAERGITGTCLVTYTVTTLGTVKDVKIVEGACENEIFARPSVEAAYRFKYKPRVINGEAIEVLGVYNRFFYEQQQRQQ
ncbi:MAG: TonB family protein [Pseudomonadota bacterium]